MNKLKHALAAALVSVIPGVGHAATVVDLTTSNEGTINGAVYSFESINAGTGLFNPMVRMNGTDVEQGYNTDGRPLPFDEDASQTHGVRLNQVPVVSFGGLRYFQFDLDINEPNNGNRYLSLDAVQIYTTPGNCDATTTTISSLGSLRYSMDAGDAGNKVLLDGNRTPGSGYSDMTLFVPVDSFAGAMGTDCIYLYSMFGSDGGAYANHSGFEEWRLLKEPGVTIGDGPIVPEPTGGLILALGGLSALVMRRRNR